MSLVAGDRFQHHAEIGLSKTYIVTKTYSSSEEELELLELELELDDDEDDFLELLLEDDSFGPSRKFSMLKLISNTIIDIF